MTTAGQNTATLERRCRMLMLAYPARYRRERAEEVIGTLLDTTPEGRAWPLRRDVAALVLGGLSARSGQNHRLGTVTDLRFIAMLGCAIYLCAVAASPGYFGLGAFIPNYSQWQAWAATILIWAAAFVPFLARRPIVVSVAVLAAAAAVVDHIAGTMPIDVGVSLLPSLLPILVPVFILVMLSGESARPPRIWLLLPGLVVAEAMVAQLLAVTAQWYPAFLWAPRIPLQVGLIAIAIAWIGIDARPAAAVALAYYLLELQYLAFFPTAANQHPAIGGAPQVGWVSLLNWTLTWDVWWQALTLAVPLTALAVWRTRRQAVL
jgi:hypothetical protein